MKTRRHILVFLLCAWAAASCIYDFDPQIDGEGGYMIVSGDLVIGTISTVTLSYSWSLVDTTATEQERMSVLYTSQMHVEDSNGGRYDNMGFGSYWEIGWTPVYGGPSARFDLTKADPSLAYRLVIENEKGTYASAWSTPISPGAIDKLSYRINDAGTHMAILISTHGDNTEDVYYRWTVTENWEYHADVQSLFKVERTGVFPDYEYSIVPYEIDENYYYCWTSGTRSEIMTGTTTDLTEDRLVDHHLYSVPRTDDRLSVLYAVSVQQARISGEAYRYWETMRTSSSDVGGLFSPEPTEFRGNVVNVNDPAELVLGYVDVERVVSDTLFVDNSVVRFYKNARAPLPEPDTLSNPAEWRIAFELENKLPAVDVYDELTGRLIGYQWWPVRCVDCRYRGGTKNKPAWWPNSHR